VLQRLLELKKQRAARLASGVPYRVTQGRPDLCHDDGGTMMDVGGSKSQEAKAGIDQQVLPAVVLNETLTVIAPVIFENKAGGRVIEVCPTDELLTAVAEVGLDLRVR
jgi:hypothetical protein